MNGTNLVADVAGQVIGGNNEVGIVTAGNICDSFKAGKHG